jgi:drug/metabolite transporter (DMT)-like permease
VRHPDAIGVAMYLVAAFLFALNGVIAKAALNTGFDPMHLTQLRNAGAMVLLVAYIALRRIGAQRAGIVGTTEPLWAGVVAFLMLGETFDGIQILGGLIVLAGVIVAETSRRSGVAVTPGEFPQILD